MYSCVQKQNKKQYAVKVIDKRLIDKDWRNLHSIIKEVDILRDLSHPNIIPLYEVYESERHIYLVMKYVDGGQLYDRIIDGHIYSES